MRILTSPWKSAVLVVFRLSAAPGRACSGQGRQRGHDKCTQLHGWQIVNGGQRRGMDGLSSQRGEFSS
jgi:hypothetical protein